MAASSIGIDRITFDRIAREYRRSWRIDLCAAALDGRIVFGEPPCKSQNQVACRKNRAHAIAESLRWGEPTVTFCDRRRLIWAIPLMHNAKALGGLIATTTEKRIFPDKSGSPALDIRTVCGDLRTLAERENLVNADMMLAHRVESQRQRDRAETIHQLKLLPPVDIRQMYLREEPALLAAIRKDDRGEARNILNRILAAIYYRADKRIDLIKSFFMELVVTMCRTAVEAGGNVDELFGANLSRLSELSGISSQEKLAPWLRDLLERIMDSIRRHPRKPHSVLAEAALRYMSEHFYENIARDDVAEALNLSPSHFSRLLKKQLGKSFTELLNHMRVNRAAELLVRTDKPLSIIALDVGFKDQSYFTKVFRRYLSLPPRQYRNRRLAND
jgi:AraC-like DNA-binding protein